jgi:hypothetical protein
VPVTVVTLGWLFLWQAIVGNYVATGATSAFYGMSRGEQWATMMPVQLDVLRLLSWPMLLASDYSPQTVAIRLSWGPLAVLGFVSAAAVLLLGLLTIRRAPAVAFGVLLAAGSYAPTSNLVFTSGVVLAERALYLAVLAPALVLGWIMAQADARPWRRLAWSAAGLYCLVLAGRAVSRTPYWRDAQDMIIEDVVDNPQNYRAHIHLGDMFATRHDSARALAHYLTAAALAEHDPFTFQFIVGSAVAVGRPQLAVSEGRRVHDIAPHDPRTGGWLAEAYVAAGLPDSAVAVTERNLRQHPGGPSFVANYLWSLRRAGAPPAQVLAIQALEDWLAGRLVQAAARLDSLATMASDVDSGFCEAFVLAREAIAVLKPELLATIEERLGQECPVMSTVQKSDGHAN